METTTTMNLQSISFRRARVLSLAFALHVEGWVEQTKFHLTKWTTAHQRQKRTRIRNCVRKEKDFHFQIIILQFGVWNDTNENMIATTNSVSYIIRLVVRFDFDDFSSSNFNFSFLFSFLLRFSFCLGNQWIHLLLEFPFTRNRNFVFTWKLSDLNVLNKPSSKTKMNTNYDLLDLQYGGRKGKTCSMTGCTNTHQRCPSLSFFRFPKEINRWICKLGSDEATEKTLCSPKQFKLFSFSPFTCCWRTKKKKHAQSQRMVDYMRSAGSDATRWLGRNQREQLLCLRAALSESNSRLCNAKDSHQNGNACFDNGVQDDAIFSSRTYDECAQRLRQTEQSEGSRRRDETRCRRQLREWWRRYRR